MRTPPPTPPPQSSKTFSLLGGSRHPQPPPEAAAQGMRRIRRQLAWEMPVVSRLQIQLTPNLIPWLWLPPPHPSLVLLIMFGSVAFLGKIKGFLRGINTKTMIRGVIQDISA